MTAVEIAFVPSESTAGTLTSSTDDAAANSASITFQSGHLSVIACAKFSSTARTAPPTSAVGVPLRLCHALSAMSSKNVFTVIASSSLRCNPAKTSQHACRSPIPFRSIPSFALRLVVFKRFSWTCPSCSSFLGYSGSILNAASTSFKETSCFSAAGKLPEFTICSQSRIFLSHEPTSRNALPAVSTVDFKASMSAKPCKLERLLSSTSLMLVTTVASRSRPVRTSVCIFSMSRIVLGNWVMS
mmetsp:Transcript_35918/g.82474  ORF Transcript_35918/g.82474 Transcript_35918/m.82474 type:complete len:243 (+) Transcript_35918:1073-1801(+)